jgi:hypothetical protein
MALKMTRSMADDSISICATAFYSRTFDEVIDREIVNVVKEMAKEAVTQNPIFREKIAQAVESAITSLTVATLVDVVRQEVRATLKEEVNETSIYNGRA